MLALLSVSLCGCLGGSLGVQIARSILLQGADKLASDAYDRHLLKEQEASRNVVLKDTVPDQYWVAFATSGFKTMTPSIEPLPTANYTEDKPLPVQTTQLVRVELWNLLIGEEKRSVLEKGRLLGASTVPPPSEWKNWQVATGALDSDKTKPITFLIPPGFGKMSSGEAAFIELAGAGDFNIARYPIAKQN